MDTTKRYFGMTAREIRSRYPSTYGDGAVIHQLLDEVERLERELATMKKLQMPGAYFPPLHDKKAADMGDINSPK